MWLAGVLATEETRSTRPHSSRFIRTSVRVGPIDRHAVSAVGVIGIRGEANIVLGCPAAANIQMGTPVPGTPLAGYFVRRLGNNLMCVICGPHVLSSPAAPHSGQSASSSLVR